MQGRIGFIVLLLIILAITFLVVSVAVGDSLWKITAYCSCEKCCEEFADNRFAMGMPICKDIVNAPVGFIACNILEFGTRVKIDDKIYIVVDRGAKSLFGTFEKPIKHIDIWLPSHQEALNKGVEYKEVEIL